MYLDFGMTEQGRDGYAPIIYVTTTPKPANWDELGLQHQLKWSGYPQ